MTPKPMAEKKLKAWAIVDTKEDKITFVTLQKGNWHIAPSERKRFKPRQVTITL